MQKARYSVTFFSIYNLSLRIDSIFFPNTQRYDILHEHHFLHTYPKIARCGIKKNTCKISYSQHGRRVYTHHDTTTTTTKKKKKKQVDNFPHNPTTHGVAAARGHVYYNTQHLSRGKPPVHMRAGARRGSEQVQ